jgi:hypothetical protein
MPWVKMDSFKTMPLTESSPSQAKSASFTDQVKNIVALILESRGIQS